MMDVVSLALSKNYTDKEIIKAAASLKFKQQIVESLPSSGEIHTIYFIKNNSSQKDDYYDLYLWISDTNNFEKVGSTKISEFPTSLPNPNAITFTGAVTGSYDGSAPLTINIPDGGSGTDSNAVHYTEDSDKTDEEKAKARSNIGAQETINDLENIRRGAELGAKSVQQTDVTEIEITKSSTVIADIESDTKILTPAAAHKLNALILHVEHDNTNDLYRLKEGYDGNGSPQNIKQLLDDALNNDIPILVKLDKFYYSLCHIEEQNKRIVFVFVNYTPSSHLYMNTYDYDFTSFQIRIRYWKEVEGHKLGEYSDCSRIISFQQKFPESITINGVECWTAYECLKQMNNQ